MTAQIPTVERKRPPRRRLAAAIAAGVVVFALTAAVIPVPPSLSDDVTGDAALAARVTELLEDAGGVRHNVAVAVIDGDEVTYAGLGADETTEFEIGSVTKTFTAFLLADAIERGEVEATTPLGDLLDLGDSDAAGITLEELASHRSGLPRVDTGPQALLRSILAQFGARDPYAGASVEELEAAARRAGLGNRGEVEYSNLGFALLGQALARAADTTYPELVQQRVLDPLGLDSTYEPSASGLRPGAPTGYTDSGRAADAWTLDAYAPAGSLRSTAEDMVAYLRAVAERDDLLDDRWDTGDGDRIGLAWFTSEADGQSVVWHNGGTGGYRSIVAFDRDDDRAVVVLSDTAVSVDAIGIALLTGADS